MEINKNIPRKQQAQSICDHIISAPKVTKLPCDDYDSYWLYSQNGLLLQAAIFHSGNIDLAILGAAPLGLSNNNRISFDDNYTEFIDLLGKAF